MAKRPVVWVSAYISSKALVSLERDLAKSNIYKGVKVFIPTIRVLKKKHKGKEHYEDIPMLFNYGFFRIPKYFIPNSHFMKKMREDITAIYAWVTDRCIDTTMNHTLNRKYFLHNPLGIGIIRERDILKVKKCQKTKSIYNAADVANLYPGKIVILRGYPFDGLDAEIIHINTTKKEVEVKLLLQTHMSRVRVSFDNIFYTIYKDAFMNTEMKETSLEALGKRFER
jgi:transcription antitermination factor NusG